jgi:hypothetical protein
MSITHPKLALSFRGVVGKQSATIENTIAGTGAYCYWECPDCAYLWEATGDKRAGRGQGCPRCGIVSRAKNRRVPKIGKSIAEHPILSLDYALDKNINLPQSVSAGTHDLLWWRCGSGPSCRHLWQTSGHARTTMGNGCPKCNTHYSVSEHLSNTYLKHILARYKIPVDIETGKTSNINNPKGRSFQVDARIHLNGKLIAYMYDGYAGHTPDSKSRLHDIQRRTGLCSVVHKVLVHRHGMGGIAKEVGELNYTEVETHKYSSILLGIKANIINLLAPRHVAVDVEEVFQEARISWALLPKSNLAKLETAIKRERKAVFAESLLHPPRGNTLPHELEQGDPDGL